MSPTLKGIREITGRNKLGPVREALVQKDDDWKEWDLAKLAENLRKYFDRHPGVDRKSTQLAKSGQTQLLYGGDAHKRPKCIYCDSTEHSAVRCTKVLNVADWRGISRQKKVPQVCAETPYLGVLKAR